MYSIESPRTKIQGLNLTAMPHPSSCRLTGFTLIECLISIILLTMVLAGGLAFYFYSNDEYQTARHRLLAVEIANTLMEEIRQNGYSALPSPAPDGLWQGPVNINLSHLTAQERIYVFDLDDDASDPAYKPYKQVDIKISWTDPVRLQTQDVKVSTYLAS